MDYMLTNTVIFLLIDVTTDWSGWGWQVARRGVKETGTDNDS